MGSKWHVASGKWQVARLGRVLVARRRRVGHVVHREVELVDQVPGVRELGLRVGPGLGCGWAGVAPGGRAPGRRAVVSLRGAAGRGGVALTAREG